MQTFMGTVCGLQFLCSSTVDGGNPARSYRPYTATITVFGDRTWCKTSATHLNTHP